MATITLELVEILDAIDRRGSFMKAAEELNKVPSALSYTIQKYEESLGITLFVRQGRKSVFTPPARHLLEQGRDLLLAENQLTAEVKTLASGWEPSIRIAVDSLVSMDTVMRVLDTFLTAHPNVELDICEEVLGGSWEALIQDRVELVIGAPAPKPTGLGIRTEPLVNIDRVFAVAKNHPLASAATPISQETVQQYRQVIVHDSARNSIARTNRLFSTSARFYVSSIELKVEAQKAGIGVGYLPRHRIQSLLDSGDMVELSIDGMSTEDPLFVAWKATNRGKGLKSLVSSLLAENFRR